MRCVGGSAVFFNRYPFSISKTALVAVGSPHTWPSLLASLIWLVDLLSVRMRLEVDLVRFTP